MTTISKEQALRTITGQIVRNSILQQIPHEEFQSLERHLEFIPLEPGTILQHQSEPIQHAYFINRGIVSKVVEMEDGRSVEIGLAGCEHMVGLQLAVGLGNLMYNLAVQVRGDGFRLSASSLTKSLPSLPRLSAILIRRLGIQSVQFARNAACNRLHHGKQRLARRLLLIFDRIDSDNLVITHESISRMVGTDRPSISIALAELQREKVIAVGRGSLSLLNRRKLEEQSCECYRILSQFNEELGLLR